MTHFQCLGCFSPGDGAPLASNSRSRVQSPYGLWTCDPMCRVWKGASVGLWKSYLGSWSGGGHHGHCGCVTPGTGSWGQDHPGDCGHVIPGTASGRLGSAWVMWTFDPKCRVWGEGYEDWMCDSSAWSERVSPWRLWMCDSTYGV